MAEIVAELSQLARQSPHVNQRSGVSVRLSIANYETLVANAVRRALRLGEPDAVPRVSDLGALVASTQGKIEIEALEEGREERIVAAACVSAAVLTVFRRRCPDRAARPASSPPSTTAGWSTPATTFPSSAYVEVLAELPALEGPVLALAGERDAGRGGQRRRVPPRGPAPHQAAQQGGGRGQGHLPGPRMTRRGGRRHDQPLVVPALGRHPARLRGRGRRPVRRAGRRPALPRRPRRGPAPAAHRGLPATRRRAGPGPARADGAPAPAAPGGARPRRPRRRVRRDRPGARRGRRPRSAPGSRTWPRRPGSPGDERRQEVTDEVVAERQRRARPPAPRPGRPGAGPAALRLHLLARPASTSSSCWSSCARRWPRAASTRCPRP